MEKNNINNFDITSAHQQSYFDEKNFKIDHSEEILDDLFEGPPVYLSNIKKGINHNKRILNNLNNNDTNALEKINDVLMSDNKIKLNMYSLLNYINDKARVWGFLDYIQSNGKLLNKKDKKGLRELLIIFSDDLSHDYYGDAQRFQDAKNEKNNEIKYQKNHNRENEMKNNPMFKAMINEYILTMNKILENLDK